MNITYRPYQPGDAGFVVETTCKVRWPRDHRDWRAWEEEYAPLVHKAIYTGRCVVAESDGVLLGFAIVDANRRLWMLYVKRSFRGAGIGLELSAKADVINSHEPTPSLLAWARYHKLGLT